MRKTMPFVLAIFFALALYPGCDDPPTNSYSFDIRNTETASGRAIAADAVFCDLSKFEVELDFLYIRYNGTDADEFTLINVPAGNPVAYVINLVSQSLSDVIPPHRFDMANVHSDSINKIWMGFAPTVTVCGYVRDNFEGIVYRTDALGGIIPDDGLTPSDCSLPLSGTTEGGIPAYSVDPYNPPLDTTLAAVYLWLVGGNNTSDLFDMRIPEGGSFEFLFPTHIGIVRAPDGTWRALSMRYGFPYVPGVSQYYEFYLRHVPKEGYGLPEFYTDYVRILLSGTGNLILGQAQSTPHIFHLSSFFNYYQLDIFYDADSDSTGAQYSNYFRRNEDGSLYISDNNQTGAGNYGFPALQLTDHTGILNLGAVFVPYEATLLH